MFLLQAYSRFQDLFQEGMQRYSKFYAAYTSYPDRPVPSLPHGWPHHPWIADVMPSGLIATKGLLVVSVTENTYIGQHNFLDWCHAGTSTPRSSSVTGMSAFPVCSSFIFHFRATAVHLGGNSRAGIWLRLWSQHVQAQQRSGRAIRSWPDCTHEPCIPELGHRYVSAMAILQV